MIDPDVLIYWRRRAVAAAAVLGLVLVIVWAMSGPSQPNDVQASSETNTAGSSPLSFSDAPPATPAAKPGPADQAPAGTDPTGTDSTGGDLAGQAAGGGIAAGAPAGAQLPGAGLPSTGLPAGGTTASGPVPAGSVPAVAGPPAGTGSPAGVSPSSSSGGSTALAAPGTTRPADASLPSRSGLSSGPTGAGVPTGTAAAPGTARPLAAGAPAAGGHQLAAGNPGAGQAPGNQTVRNSTAGLAQTRPGQAAGSRVSPGGPPAVDAVTPCGDHAVALLAQSSSTSYKLGERPLFRLVVANIGGKPCSRDLDPGLQALVVNGPGGQLWNSNDCDTTHHPDVRVLEPGKPQVFSLAWAGRTSHPGCGGARQAVAAGSYQLVGKLGSLSSSPSSFTMGGGSPAEPGSQAVVNPAATTPGGQAAPAKPATKPAVKPAVKPETQPATKPGTQPAAKPGTEATIQPPQPVTGAAGTEFPR